MLQQTSQKHIYEIHHILHSRLRFKDVQIYYLQNPKITYEKDIVTILTFIKKRNKTTIPPNVPN